MTILYSGTIYIPITPNGWTLEEVEETFNSVTTVADMFVCRVEDELRNPADGYWFPKGTVFDLYYKGVVK